MLYPLKTSATWFPCLIADKMSVFHVLVISPMRISQFVLPWKASPPTPTGSVPSLVRNAVRNSPAMFFLYALRSARMFDRGWEAFFLPETA